MTGRIAHYIKKAKTKIHTEGVGGFLKEGILFLIRRKFLLQFLGETFEYKVLSHFRNIPATVNQVVKKEVIISRRILIYASYDARSEIGEHIIAQLKCFQSDGYQSVFISTSPDLPIKEYEKIKDLVSICVRRRNEGYDFVSYRVGFDLIAPRISALESLVFMNDSCLGPLFDFKPFLSKMRTSKNSVFGISKSEEIAEHIQSYFYHFGSGVLASKITHDFFERIRILHSKWAIVRYFEIGSSRFLSERGVKLEALVDPKDQFIKNKMNEEDLTEPTREPLASEWVRLKMNPFYKRSNPKI